MNERCPLEGVCFETYLDWIKEDRDCPMRKALKSKTVGFDLGEFIRVKIADYKEVQEMRIKNGKV